MTEELRLAVRDSEQPLQEVAEAVLWLEQMLGVEVAGPSSDKIAATQVGGRF